MVYSILTKEPDLKNLINIYKKNLDVEPEGNKMFNIYDCRFSVNIYYDNQIIPLETEIEYFYKCNLSLKNNFDFITLKSKPLNNDNIILEYNKILGFSISCQYCSNCKEYLIKKIKNHVKVPYLTENKKRKLEEYSKNLKIKFCFKNNTDFTYYNKYENHKLYLHHFICKLSKENIKSKFIPDFGENYNNPLFNIKKWESEITLNGKKIDLSKFDENDLPKSIDYYKKNLYVFISPKGIYESFNECEIKYGDKLSFSIFMTYNNKKFRIKYATDVPIGKIIIDRINKIKKEDNIQKDLLDNVEVKYKNTLYSGGYMLKPDIIKRINDLREKGEYNKIEEIENISNNYYYNMQYIRCSILTSNLLDIIML